MEKPKASEAEGEVASLAKQSRALRMEAKPRVADNHEQSEAIMSECEANRTSAEES